MEARRFRSLHTKPGGANNFLEGSRRRPVTDTVMLPGGIQGAPARLLATSESAARAFDAARAVYVTVYAGFRLDQATIDTRLASFDEGRQQILSGMFPENGAPIDVNMVGLGIRVLRNAAEAWQTANVH